MEVGRVVRPESEMSKLFREAVVGRLGSVVMALHPEIYHTTEAQKGSSFQVRELGRTVLSKKNPPEINAQWGITVRALARTSRIDRAVKAVKEVGSK